MAEDLVAHAFFREEPPASLFVELCTAMRCSDDVVRYLMRSSLKPEKRIDSNDVHISRLAELVGTDASDDHLNVGACFRAPYGPWWGGGLSYQGAAFRKRYSSTGPLMRYGVYPDVWFPELAFAPRFWSDRLFVAEVQAFAGSKNLEEFMALVPGLPSAGNCVTSVVLGWEGEGPRQLENAMAAWVSSPSDLLPEISPEDARRVLALYVRSPPKSAVLEALQPDDSATEGHVPWKLRNRALRALPPVISPGPGGRGFIVLPEGAGLVGKVIEDLQRTAAELLGAMP